MVMLGDGSAFRTTCSVFGLPRVVVLLIVTRSGCPSPSTSTASTAIGLEPAARSGCCANATCVTPRFTVESFRSNLMTRFVPDGLFATTATSSVPEPSRSTIAPERGAAAVVPVASK